MAADSGCFFRGIGGNLVSHRGNELPCSEYGSDLHWCPDMSSMKTKAVGQREGL